MVHKHNHLLLFFSSSLFCLSFVRIFFGNGTLTQRICVLCRTNKNTQNYIRFLLYEILSLSHYNIPAIRW